MVILFELSLFLWFNWWFLNLVQQSRRTFLVNRIRRLVLVWRISPGIIVNERKSWRVLFRLKRPSDLTLSPPTLLLRMLLLHKRSPSIDYWQVWAINCFHHSLFILDDILNGCNAGVFVVDLSEMAYSIVTTWHYYTGFYCARRSNYPCHQLPVLKIYPFCFLLFENIVFRCWWLRVSRHAMQRLWNRLRQIALQALNLGHTYSFAFADLEEIPEQNLVALVDFIVLLSFFELVWANLRFKQMLLELGVFVANFVLAGGYATRNFADFLPMKLITPIIRLRLGRKLLNLVDCRRNFASLVLK